MYNRKINVKRDFNKLVDLEYKALPIIRGIKNDDDREYLENYIRGIFNNQFKQ